MMRKRAEAAQDLQDEAEDEKLGSLETATGRDRSPDDEYGSRRHRRATITAQGRPSALNYGGNIEDDEFIDDEDADAPNLSEEDEAMRTDNESGSGGEDTDIARPDEGYIAL